jgi:protein CpxP
MTKRILIAAGLVAALGGGSMVALAEPSQGGPGGRFTGRGQRGAPGGVDLGLRGISLTDSEREQVRSIMDTHRAALQETAGKVREAHRAMAEAARAESVDEAAIRAQSTALANALAEETLLQARVRAEVHGILTAEQLQQMKERHDAMLKRMEQRRQQMEQRQKERQERRPGH